MAGVSERICRVCRKFNIKVFFRSGPTLHSLLSKVKDSLPMEKRSGVVYEVPCQCGKVYIRETKLRLETRIKEHEDACKKYHRLTGAVAEYWTWP